MATDSSNPGNPSAPKPATLIHHGEHDTDVLKLQQQLHRLGYPVATDGVFGPQTEAALRDAQAHAGVTPNGIAGPQSTLALANLESHGYHADPQALHGAHSPGHGHHEPLATEHLHAQEMANLAQDHHGHPDHGHYGPDADLGTLPFPEEHHEDPDAAHLGHYEDPYKPEEDHDIHDPNAHEDPHSSHHEPEPRDDEGY
jgi:hypothetical protein